ncbi:peroxiredoxin family protein [Brevibacillus laterosporus]|uniref:Alkyl hydroperoxide reductase n=1 Tax=Brevibacillus laterosporus TaxID=1465 RepID=A0AAP8QAH7_BRELA|nr:redoxin domain-containing protein [Brevibacillus laterosporus]MED1666023.1 redoxin domain-containing protein [Brevibacillus laterosporus]MED1667804.1 redoxin domain-containing protein [Brevibacillus laterosporus]MED1719593.1 redoxin domain-containing protein [Brevibacillus laterosporus]NKQ18674.1 redoxin domain-containing protein [Brevibacillus laterosporus]PPA89995.1 alkyl hydroperoxide reductase [Brevibacillus laterosporus]
MSKKLVRDTGLEIGTTISQIHFTNWDSSKLELNFLPKGAALVFVSVFCSYCIDLLPHLRSISQRQNMQLYLFSDGEIEDHAEMVDYFEWEFPVIQLKHNEMNEIFEVTYHPFLLFVDSKGVIVSKGDIYNAVDFHKILESVSLQ